MRCGRRWLGFCVALFWSVLLADSARALSVSDFSVAEVNNATGFLSGNGLLEFSHFEFWLGDAPRDAFTLSVLDDGIRLTGPTSVADGAKAEFYFRYQVSVLGDGPLLNGVSLFAPSTISGDGFPVFAKSSKLVFPGTETEFFGQDDTILNLQAINFDDTHQDLVSGSFSPQQTIWVLDAIRLSSAQSGDSASVESISNTYAVVPEPTTLALLSLGLTGLAVASRHSRGNAPG